MTPDILADLPRIAREADAAELPRLRAALAEADSIALARLVTPPTNGNGNDDADGNLSANEAARRLGVSRDWLYKTDLPFKLRIGKRVVFSAPGLERWNRQRMGRS